MPMSVDEALEYDTVTREEFHRLRDGPHSNGDSPAASLSHCDTDEKPAGACETCGAPLDEGQSRFCSRRCGTSAARAAPRPSTLATVGPLVAVLLAEPKVAEVEFVIGRLRVRVRPAPKG